MSLINERRVARPIKDFILTQWTSEERLRNHVSKSSIFISTVTSELGFTRWREDNDYVFGNLSLLFIT